MDIFPLTANHLVVVNYAGTFEYDCWKWNLDNIFDDSFAQHIVHTGLVAGSGTKGVNRNDTEGCFEQPATASHADRFNSAAGLE